MTDFACNTVFIPACLIRYPETYGRLCSKLSTAGVHVQAIYDTANVWARDYMPVQTPTGFVKFRYVKDFEKYPHLHVNDLCWRTLLQGVTISDIALDGGNVVRHGDRILMTEQVFKDNPGVNRTVLLDNLETLLGAEIICIPVEPGDDLGHADGIVHWIDGHRVFVNDYHAAEMVEYSRRLAGILHENGIEAKKFPNVYYRRPQMSEEDFRRAYPAADDFNPGYGYYVNFLQVAGLILFPCFGVQEDACVDCRLDEVWPNIERDAVPCTRLSMEGGLLRCVTAQYQR